MAKLGMPETAGWNAGKNYYAKPFRIAEIVIDPEISKIFAICEKNIGEITRKIKTAGYDRSQPVAVWKGENILLDGHTRLAAAKEAGLDEIPAVEMEFGDREDALMYTFERQVMRRNLTASEILTAAGMMRGKKERDGKGREAEQLAERLGISPATVYQARKIIAEAPEEDVRAVRNGERTIGSVYNQVKKTKPRDSEIMAGKVTTAIGKISEARELATDPGCLGLLDEALKCLRDAVNRKTGGETEMLQK